MRPDEAVIVGCTVGAGILVYKGLRAVIREISTPPQKRFQRPHITFVKHPYRNEYVPSTYRLPFLRRRLP